MHQPPIDQFVASVLDAVDARDTDKFLDYLDVDVRFRFGNAEPVTGHDKLREVLDGFFSAIAGIRHRLDQVHVDGDSAYCHGWVTYRRHDGSELTVPFANVFGLRRNRIRDYLIFVDNSGLFRPE